VKKYIPLLLLLPLFQSFRCVKGDLPLPVRLNATINDTAANIRLGDTLRITLVLPDTLVSNGERIVVHSLQEAMYSFTLASLDTIQKVSDRVKGTNVIFATEGATDGYSVYTRTGARPYRSIIHLVPPEKGMYYVQIVPQPGKGVVNKTVNIAPIVNFAVPDKHWNLYETHVPGFINAVSPLDADGYGWYIFRVI
jgi:hypothetical protein